jgi:hypothetical protein
VKTLEDIAELIRAELVQSVPWADFTVETGKNTNDRPSVYVGWYNLPHESVVRAAALRATDVLTTAERGFKINHRHRFSRNVKAYAGEIIRQEVPDFDYLTPKGFIDQDSRYYYHAPEGVSEVTIGDERLTLRKWNSTLSLVHRVCWLLLDAEPGRSR